MLKNRLMVQMIIASIIGISAGTVILFPIIFSIIMLSFGGLFFISIFLLYRKKKIDSKQLFSLSLIGILIISFSYSQMKCSMKYPQISSVNSSDSSLAIEGDIVESNRNYIDIQVTDGEIKSGTKIRIYNYENESSELYITAYQRCEIEVILTECPKYIKAEGVSFYASGTIHDIKKSTGNYIRRLAYKTQKFLTSNIDNTFSGSFETSSFIKAVILGDTSSLSDSIYSDFGRLGITHIVAVSGLHFTVIIMTLYAILRFFRIPRVVRSFACIPFAFFYCLMTGSSPSSVRAFIMIIFVLVGYALIYKIDPLSSLSSAALIILLINPYSIYSTSFILSFIATFAITISPPFLEFKDLYHEPKLIKKLNRIVQSIFITLIISLFIAPTLYDRFNTFSLITPLANLFLSFAFPLLMYTSLLAVLLSCFYVPNFIVTGISYLIEIFISIVSKAASLKNISIAPTKTLMVIIYVLIALCVFAALFLKKQKRNFIIRTIVISFVIILGFNVATNFYTLKKYDQLVFSDDGSSLIFISDNKIYYIVENENFIEDSFLISNNIIDFDSLIIKEITDEKKTYSKINNLLYQCRFNSIYSPSDKIQFENINTCKIEKLSAEKVSLSSKYGIDLFFDINDSVLWLGNNSRGFNKTKSIDKIVLSESFFNNRANLASIPKDVDEFYIPDGIDNYYSMRFIEINYPDSQIHSIKDFHYKEK